MHSQSFSNPSAVQLHRMRNRYGGVAGHEPRQMHMPSSWDVSLPFGKTRKAMLVDPRRGKKEKPLFEKAYEAIKTEAADVALKNTDDWTVVSNDLVKSDESPAKHHNESIGTLVVFVGLFSAIPTALVIKACKPLQQDSVDSSVQILQQISQHLTSFTVNSSSIAPT
ncbi:hypothetical protein NLI96_g11956 [Meripilus lineatus]|uniref:DUF6535 domain-containing protein n=1 Tax=Meripilus lineatus TaxID=2056292 RepID=A0AAD5YAD4_9APHY|nr:hypothetical protein NLI96_g11956 [Physisporinus lineatus]